MLLKDLLSQLSPQNIAEIAKQALSASDIFSVKTLGNCMYSFERFSPNGDYVHYFTVRVYRQGGRVHMHILKHDKVKNK